MQGLAVALFPVLLMLFALVMERVENRLRDILEPDEEVQRYLDKATNAEVAELEEMGVPAAAAKFRRRGRKAAGHTEDLDVARAG